MTFSRQSVGNRILTNVLGMRITQPRSAVSAPGWWLSGGISAANCIAAYAAKGAASYAASKSNLANPGTYDANDEGTHAIDWDSVNGWKQDGLISSYLLTGISPDDTWSMIANVTNFQDMGAVDANTLCGVYDDNPNHAFYIDNYNYKTRASHGNVAAVVDLTVVASGNIAIAGKNTYVDAVAKSTIGAGAGTTYGPLAIGAKIYNGSPVNYAGVVYIQSLAIYDTTITGDQVTALKTAMDAL